MKGHALLQGEIITKKRNTLTKFKIFFSRTKKPILTKLGTKHPWVKGIQVCAKEGLHPFPRGDNHEIGKIHWQILKIFFSRTSGPILTEFVKKHPLLKETQGFTNKDHSIIKKEMMCFFLSKSMLWYNHSFEQVCLLFDLISQVSNVVHGPLVIFTERWTCMHMYLS